MSDIMRLRDKLNLSTRPSLPDLHRWREIFPPSNSKTGFSVSSRDNNECEGISWWREELLVHQPWNPFRRRRSFSFRNISRRRGFSQQFRMEIHHNESWRRDLKLLTYGIRLWASRLRSHDEQQRWILVKNDDDLDESIQLLVHHAFDYVPHSVHFAASCDHSAEWRMWWKSQLKHSPSCRARTVRARSEVEI